MDRIRFTGPTFRKQAMESRRNRFLSEANRSKVFRTAGLYAVAAAGVWGKWEQGLFFPKPYRFVTHSPSFAAHQRTDHG